MPALKDKAVRFAKSDRVAGFVDQGLQSSVKFVALLLFARWLTKEEFGLLALTLALIYMAAGLQRAAIILPFIVSCPTVEQVRQKGGHWFWLNIVLAAAFTAALAGAYGIAAALDSPLWIQRTLCLSIMGVAPLMLYDFTRRWLYQSKRHSTILAMSVTNFVAYAAGVAIVYFTVHEVWAAILAFAAAYTLGVIVARIGDRPPGLNMARGMASAWLQTRSFTGWQLLATLVHHADHQVIGFVIGALSNVASVAVFTATMSMIRPIGVVASAVDMIDKPRAGRAYAAQGLQGLTKSIRGTRRLLLLFGIPYLVLMFVFSGDIMTLVYGDKYTGHVLELRLWIATASVGLLSQPLETKMITLQLSRSLFWCKLVSTAVIYSLLILLIGPYGVAGVIGSVLVGTIVKVLLFFLASWSGMKRMAAAAAMPAGNPSDIVPAPDVSAPAEPRPRNESDEGTEDRRRRADHGA